MSQQEMHFDEFSRDRLASSSAQYQDAPHYEEINRDRPPSSSSDEEGVPHYNDAFIGSFGQKLSGQETRKTITLDQRLVLAIISLLLLMLMSLIGIGLALVTDGGGEITRGHAFRPGPDFGPGGGMVPPPDVMYTHFPAHAHYWMAAPTVLPMFVFVFLTFAIAVIVINALFHRSTQRS
jgi:hypothetical protein